MATPPAYIAIRQQCPGRRHHQRSVSRDVHPCLRWHVTAPEAQGVVIRDNWSRILPLDTQLTGQHAVRQCHTMAL